MLKDYKVKDYMINILSSRFLFILVASFYPLSIHADVIWPAMFIANSIYNALFLVLISVVIEGLVLRWFIPAISYTQAMLVSLIGNAASALVGTFVMALFMILWHFAVDRFLGGTFNFVNYFVSYIFMYIGSCIIELLTIKLIFRYSFKQLWVPVAVGNLITYVLAFLFNLVLK